MTEAQLQDAIVQSARALGWLDYHTFDSRRSTGGFPDLVLVRRRRQSVGGRARHVPARLIFAELKSATGTVSAPQRAWLEILGELAGDAALGETVPARVDVFEWRPDDWTSGRVELELRR